MFKTILLKTAVVFSIVLLSCGASLNSSPPVQREKSLWPVITKHFVFAPDAHIAQVKQMIAWYQKNPHYLNQITNNATPFLYYIYQATDQQHLPAELALIPFVESDYYPFAHSKAGAVGLWQLMPKTAKSLGITINREYDGREDVVASTQAALHYLATLHQRFHTWPLAFAAYNAGAGTVAKAIRYNQQHHLSTDFWSLRLPRETRSYVPKLMALNLILKHPSHYGVTLPAVSDQPFFTSVAVNQTTNLSHDQRFKPINAVLLHQLNAGFCQWPTTPHHRNAVLVPTSARAVADT